MAETMTRVGWRRGEPADALLDREWLIGNGLGGYATGTLAGACTRRYHGLLVASLAGVGRTVFLSHHADQVRLAQRHGLMQTGGVVVEERDCAGEPLVDGRGELTVAGQAVDDRVGGHRPRRVAADPAGTIVGPWAPPRRRGRTRAAT